MRTQMRTQMRAHMRTQTRINAGRQSQSGFALVVVLWLAVLLSLLAAGFNSTVRSEARVARNTMSQAQAQAAADAGVHRGLFDLFKFTNQDEVWKPDGAWHEIVYGDAQVRVRMLNESGKIDVNTANEQLLRGLFKSVGVADETEVSRLVDAIKDWQDNDSLKRLNGAEELDYSAAGLNYKPANAPFQTIEELNLVLGMTPSLFRRIQPIITVYSRQPGLNVQIAPREALLAIPNITVEQVDTFIAQREAARAAKQPVPPFPAVGFFVGGGNALAVSLVAEAKMPDGTTFVRDAVVFTSPGNIKRPYSFLAWREGATTSATTISDNAAVDTGVTQ
jgi:general secretion pathway protein K